MNKNEPWYETLFANSAIAYDKEPFVGGTAGEVDFLEKEMDCKPWQRILDIGCGTGRHALDLAARGHHVVGIDLSAGQIAHARRKAEERRLNVKLEVKDARTIDYEDEFNLALCLCEGAFALMASDEEDMRILRGAYRALQNGGKLVMTTLNALHTLTRPQLSNQKFDLVNQRLTYELEGVDDDNQKSMLTVTERHYTPSEMVFRLKLAGFADVEVFGCVLGSYSRDKPVTTDDFELLIVAKKAE